MGKQVKFTHRGVHVLFFSSNFADLFRFDIIKLRNKDQRHLGLSCLSHTAYVLVKLTVIRA